jgi:hypothetical protein
MRVNRTLLGWLRNFVKHFAKYREILRNVREIWRNIYEIS